jgi:hypothetical protein
MMRPMNLETLPAPAGVADQTRPARTTTDAQDRAPAVERGRPNLLDSGSSDPAGTDPTPGREAGPSPDDTAAADAPAWDGGITIDESEIRQTNRRRFELSYEIESVGTQGVSAVELWGTRDGGRTWTNWGRDEDLESPFDIETNGAGLYGFAIVVIGNNGLTSPQPRSGDPADIYVRVDTEAPRVHISSARYGEGSEAGSLVLEYSCEDDNLTARPVHLAFSESPEGPWTTMATGLENTGRYAWPADPRLPREIYLRIEATDRAGNVGVETTRKPISVHGLAPRARIRGFQPITQP